MPKKIKVSILIGLIFLSLPGFFSLLERPAFARPPLFECFDRCESQLLGCIFVYSIPYCQALYSQCLDICVILYG